MTKSKGKPLTPLTSAPSLPQGARIYNSGKIIIIADADDRDVQRFIRALTGSANLPQ